MFTLEVAEKDSPSIRFSLVRDNGDVNIYAAVEGRSPELVAYFTTKGTSEKVTLEVMRHISDVFAKDADGYLSTHK